jgi:hypothetical protein
MTISLNPLRSSPRPEMISYVTEWQDVSAACDEVFVKINGKLRYLWRAGGGGIYSDNVGVEQCSSRSCAPRFQPALFLSYAR